MDVEKEGSVFVIVQIDKGEWTPVMKARKVEGQSVKGACIKLREVGLGWLMRCIQVKSSKQYE
jgi:hypothetical protein